MSNDEKMPKCPKCGGNNVIWDAETKSFVCMDENCGKEWRITNGKVKYVRWV